jgi:hypothetical protein
VNDINGTTGVSVRRTRSAPTTRAATHAASPPATTQEIAVTFDLTPVTSTPYDLMTVAAGSSAVTSDVGTVTR